MSLRIHIHRERITANKKLCHFYVKLPADCMLVKGIRLTSPKRLTGEEKGHGEFGQLRLKRDGVVFYEDYIRAEGKQPLFDFPFDIGVANGRTSIHGMREVPMNIEIGKSSSLLQAMFQASGNGKYVPFTIIIYVYYQPRS